MRRPFSRLIVIACFVLGSNLALGAPRGAGSYQWVTVGYPDLPSAAAALAAGSSDLKAPFFVVTADPQSRYVVARWQFADLWCCAPVGIEYVITDPKKADEKYHAWRNRSAAGLEINGENGFVWRVTR